MNFAAVEERGIYMSQTWACLVAKLTVSSYQDQWAIIVASWMLIYKNWNNDETLSSLSQFIWYSTLFKIWVFLTMTKFCKLIS